MADRRLAAAGSAATASQAAAVAPAATNSSTRAQPTDSTSQSGRMPGAGSK